MRAREADRHANEPRLRRPEKKGHALVQSLAHGGRHGAREAAEPSLLFLGRCGGRHVRIFPLLRSSVSVDVQTLLRSSKKTNSCSYWPPASDRSRSEAICLSSPRALFPFFFRLFLLGEQSEKNDGLSSAASSCVALAVVRVCVSGFYDGSRLSPLARQHGGYAGKRFCCSAGLRKFNPRGSRRMSRARRAHHKATILSIAPQSYSPRRH